MNRCELWWNRRRRVIAVPVPTCTTEIKFILFSSLTIFCLRFVIVSIWCAFVSVWHLFLVFFRGFSLFFVLFD